MRNLNSFTTDGVQIKFPKSFFLEKNIFPSYPVLCYGVVSHLYVHLYCFSRQPKVESGAGAEEEEEEEGGSYSKLGAKEGGDNRALPPLIHL